MTLKQRMKKNQELREKLKLGWTFTVCGIAMIIVSIIGMIISNVTAIETLYYSVIIDSISITFIVVGILYNRSVKKRYDGRF